MIFRKKDLVKLIDDLDTEVASLSMRVVKLEEKANAAKQPRDKNGKFAKKK